MPKNVGEGETSMTNKNCYNWFAETRQEAIKKRRELKDNKHDAFFVKLRWDHGYYIYAVPKGLFKKKKKEVQYEERRRRNYEG
jgi:hypothetical protein